MKSDVVRDSRICFREARANRRSVIIALAVGVVALQSIVVF